MRVIIDSFIIYKVIWDVKKFFATEVFHPSFFTSHFEMTYFWK